MAVNWMSWTLPLKRAIWGGAMPRGCWAAVNAIVGYACEERPFVSRFTSLPPPEEDDIHPNLTRADYGDKDITQISDTLYLSGFIGARAPGLYKTHFVDYVMSVGLMLSKSSCQNHCSNTRYLSFQLEDEQTARLDRILPRAIRQLAENEKAHRRTLVHCMLGISRSASVVIAFGMRKTYNAILGHFTTPGERIVVKHWFMRHQKKLYKSEYKKVKAKRDFIHPNNGFVKILESNKTWLF